MAFNVSHGSASSHNLEFARYQLVSSAIGQAVPWFVELPLLLLLVYVAALLTTTLYFASLHKFKISGGPLFVQPFLGSIVTMVCNPYQFWKRQLEYEPHGYSWTSFVGKFVVFVTKADLCHKIFFTNGPDSLTLELHPNAKYILGENNIAFSTGEHHKNLRLSFVNLFTKESLAVYLDTQIHMIRKHLNKWLATAKPGVHVEIRDLVRELNMETSQTVFLGEHLKDRPAFCKHYDAITAAFLSAPLYFPGTTLWKGVKARKLAIVILEEAVKSAKTKMSKPDAKGACLLDFWTGHVLGLIKEAAEKGEQQPSFSTDHAMADTLLDFLFASQDASTASLVNIVATMYEHPDILERVRAEQMRLRPNGEEITYDLIQQMTFTGLCVKEQIRIRPPAPMVPMMCHSDFQLTSDFKCPKGALLIPSLVGACQEGYTNPEKYDPDRWGPGRKEGDKYPKSFLAFGTGRHKCVGYNYALQHLTTFLSIVSMESFFDRKRTPKSDEMLYLPTLYPHDCLIEFSRRKFDDKKQHFLSIDPMPAATEEDLQTGKENNERREEEAPAVCPFKHQ